MKPVLSAVTPVLLPLALAAALAGCQKTVKAPTDTGVCFSIVGTKPDGTPDYVAVAKEVRTLEQCASELDAVRFNLMRVGSDRRTITGAYHGKFLFLDSGGMSVGNTLTGSRFVAFARAANGRLAIPGYIYKPEDAAPASAPAAPAEGPEQK